MLRVRRTTAVALAVALFALVQVRDAQAALGPAHTWNPVTLPVQQLDLAAPLQDGRVLLRSNEGGSAVASDYVYNPTAGSVMQVIFSPLNADGSRFTPLSNGDVLLSGRVTLGPSSGLSIFQAATGTYSQKTHMQTRLYHTATELADGRVLLAGGFDAALQPLASAAVYNPATDSFSGVASMQHARGSAAAILLDDGRVLVAGGSTVPPGFIMPIATLITQAEVFDPDTGAWSPAGNVPPHLVSALARLSDGRVLMASGFDIPTVSVLTDTVIFDPDDDTWSPAADMPAPLLSQHHATLPDGRVLVTGRSFETEMYLYDPSSDTWAEGDPSAMNFVGDGLAQRPTGELVLTMTGGALGVQIYGPDGDADGYNDLREGQLSENGASFCAIMRADVVYDGIVNSGDMGKLASKYGTQPFSTRIDQNGDNVINSGDQGKLASKYNQVVGSCT